MCTFWTGECGTIHTKLKKGRTIHVIYGASIWRRANVWNVSFETLYGGQFTLPTQLIKPNYLNICCSRLSSNEVLRHFTFQLNVPPGILIGFLRKSWVLLELNKLLKNQRFWSKQDKEPTPKPSHSSPEISTLHHSTHLPIPRDKVNKSLRNQRRILLVKRVHIFLQFHLQHRNNHECSRDISAYPWSLKLKVEYKRKKYIFIYRCHNCRVTAKFNKNIFPFRCLLKMRWLCRFVKKLNMV